MRARLLGDPTQKECVYFVWDDKGYGLVQGHVEFTTTSLPGVWCASTTLSSDVHLAYRIKRIVPSIEESSREFHDILSGLPLLLGVLGQEEYDEDI